MAPLERKGQEKYETLWRRFAGPGRGCARTARATASTSRRASTTVKHKVEVVIDRNVVKLRAAWRKPWNRHYFGRGVMHTLYVDAVDKDETKWRSRSIRSDGRDKCNLSFEPLNLHHWPVQLTARLSSTRGLECRTGPTPTAASVTALSPGEGAVTRAWRRARRGCLSRKRSRPTPGFDLDTLYERYGPDPPFCTAQAKRGFH
ncbi:MAG: hypothetical protein U0791_04590 [Gemmataceae bacterium]